jgi:transcriptional regulator with XRE-family HTH domain
MSDDVESTSQGRTARLAQLLEQLAARGVKQREVAFELNLPTQYLSDLKHGRRPVSEPFARRFAEAYRVSAAWLLQGEGACDLPNLATASARTDGSCLLPVLSAPDQGDPSQSRHWDGSLIPLSGVAVAAAERAKLPFVLRIGADIPSGRLQKGDLVLCCQEPPDNAAIVIVRAKGKVMLARAGGKDGFQTFSTGSLIPGAEPIGYCIGIVWAPL